MFGIWKRLFSSLFLSRFAGLDHYCGLFVVDAFRLRSLSGERSRVIDVCDADDSLWFPLFVLSGFVICRLPRLRLVGGA